MLMDGLPRGSTGGRGTWGSGFNPFVAVTASVVTYSDTVGESEYLLTNAREETVARFDALEEAFDDLTMGHLGRIGVAPGWRCLELGAGGGSIAAWLATQVGAEGRVVATDLDLSRFRSHVLNQLEVRRLDLVADALPVGPWDLIHERLVLQHVPARLQVLDRMVAALAPGGWIVLEDFDTAEVRTTDRDGKDHELIARVAVAFNGLLAVRGGVSSFAANARRELMNRGLVDTGSSGHVSIASGGTGFARAMAANTRQVREKLEASSLTSTELDHFFNVLDDPETLVGSPVLISTWGRRPT
jgi:SAM-dependent methyltransferase